MKNMMAVFPGQGSHYVGMGKNLQSDFPYLNEVFEEAEDAANSNLRSLCFDGPIEDLTLTQNQQPSILMISAAILAILKNEADFKPDMVAGHSLGEYSALLASGRVRLFDAIGLVRKRGQFMQEAVPVGTGAMAAVLKCDESELKEICSSVYDRGVCEVVNFNSPVQQIISGHKAAVLAACEKLKLRKKRSMLLPVSAPFHSSLMKPASDKMKPLINATTFSESKIPIVANLTGDITTKYDPSWLIEQIKSPVLWTKTLDSVFKAGMTTFVEVGPGKVLTGLALKSLPKEKISALNSEEIKELIQKLT